jgi:hypothetical protein
MPLTGDGDGRTAVIYGLTLPHRRISSISLSVVIWSLAITASTLRFKLASTAIHGKVW